MTTQTCPQCTATIDRLALVPWGDGVQRLPKVPWVCSVCAALCLMDVEDGTLTPTTEADWEPVKQRNPKLWDTIVQARAIVRQQQQEGRR